MRLQALSLVAAMLLLSPQADAQGLGSGLDLDKSYDDFGSTVGLANILQCIGFPQMVQAPCVQDELAQKQEQEETKTEAKKNLAKLLWDGLTGYIQEKAKEILRGEAEVNERLEDSSSGREDGIAQRAPVLSEKSADVASQEWMEAIDQSTTAAPEVGDGMEGVMSAKAAALFQSAEDLQRQGDALNDKLLEIGRRTGVRGDSAGEPYGFAIPDQGALPSVGNADTDIPDALGDFATGPAPDPVLSTAYDAPADALPAGIRPGSTSRGETVGFCLLPEDEKGLPNATEDVRLIVSLMGAGMAVDATQNQLRLDIGESKALRERGRLGDRTTQEWMKGAAWHSYIK